MGYERVYVYKNYEDIVVVVADSRGEWKMETREILAWTSMVIAAVVVIWMYYTKGGR